MHIYGRKALLTLVLSLGIVCLGAGSALAAPAFTDMPQSEAAASAISFVVDKNLMRGVDEQHFAPHDTLTRAMTVVTLHRFAGEPAAKTYNDFVDVKENEWYTEAIVWAQENSIVRGYGNGYFGTNDAVTRLQLAKIVRNVAYKYGLNVHVDNYDSLNGLKDESSAFGLGDTREDMAWAVANGIITPRRAGYLDPAEPATRLEVAQALQKLVSLYGEEAFAAMPESAEAETLVEVLSDESSYGTVRAEATLRFHFSDKEDAVFPVSVFSSQTQGTLESKLTLPLFANTAGNYVSDKVAYLPLFQDTALTGITAQVDKLVYGRNTIYNRCYFLINNNTYNKSMTLEKADFFDGRIDVEVTDKLRRLSLHDGKFGGDFQVFLVLEQ